MQITSKSAENMHCQICDFKCSKKGDWTRHISTRKHLNRTNENIIHAKNIIPFTCTHCNKCYKARNSLWYHQQKCQTTAQPIITDSSNNDFVFDKEFVMTILKQNADIIKENSELKTMMMDTQTQMMDVIKNGTHNTTNSHNKTFNLQFFLHLWTFKTPNKKDIGLKTTSLYFNYLIKLHFCIKP
jgi:hypothetical protein